MDITIYRAVDLQPLSPEDEKEPWVEREFALPPGRPFLVDDATLTVLESPLLYFDGRFPIRRGAVRARKHGLRTGSPNTFEAAVYDLASALRYIDKSERPWPEIDDDFIVEYGHNLLNIVSKQTHEELDFKTVMRRVSRLVDYAHWRSGNKLPVGVGTFDLSWYRAAIRGAATSTSQSKPDECIQTSGREVTKSNATNAFTAYSCDPRCILDIGQWRQIQSELGPLPSARSDDDPRSARDRLAADVAIWSALRVDEVAKLTIYQIKNLCIDDTMPPDLPIKLRVTQTKRLVARTVYLPVEVVRELQTYIDTERNECIAEAKKYWLREGARAPAALFLNSVDSHKDAGKAVTANTLSSRFHEAVLRCGFTKIVEKIDADDGSEFTTKIAAFTFHCLRHTSAVWTYYAERAAGNSEPWKVIQAILGHKQLTTTINIYLACVNAERRAINAATLRRIRSRYSGN